MTDVPEPLLERLLDARRKHRLPTQVRPLAQAFAQQVLGVMFPHFATTVVCSEEAVVEDVIEVQESLARLERAIGTLHEQMPDNLVAGFVDKLPQVHDLLLDDAQAIYEGDPAARSVDEVILTYPGFFAIAVFRVAHALFELGLPLLPRLLTEVAHERTGIDLHPGATIGRRFCIDHGTGVVIGETVEKALADSKRHPTLEDDVVIYAGATILGGQTTVGRNSIVAGNAFLTQSVPPDSIVSRKSEVRPRSAAGAVGFDWVI
jgi:serine O-acetyltransferase